MTYFQDGWLQAQEGEKSDIYSASAIGYAQPLNPEGWSWRAELRPWPRAPSRLRGPFLEPPDAKLLRRNAACSKPLVT